MSEDEIDRLATRAVAAALGDARRIDELHEAATWPPHLVGDDLIGPADPFNAITASFNVHGAPSGPLSGLRLGIKDHIPVAGAPMPGRPGERFAHDAIVIERVLAAGAVLAAATSRGDTPFGPTRNPLDPRFSPGYSSSGSGAAVAAGMVDAALGTDVAGSVRIPGAWCGLVALKPTAGRVPKFDALHHEFGEVGPMTRTVMGNERLFRVLADRASDTVPDLDGRRLGIVVESIPADGLDSGARQAFDRAARVLVALGVELAEVSVPLWPDAARILLTVEGWDFFAPIVAGIAGDDLPPFVDLAWRRLVHDGDLRESVDRARLLRTELTKQIDRALGEADVLVTPTTLTGPHRLDGVLPGILDEPSRALLRRHIANTCPLNLSGHPALTVPSGLGDGGLPAGLQLIGCRFAEDELYAVASAFETASR